MSGFFDRTGQSFAPVLMVRVSVTVTLINFVMTMILMFSSQPNVYDMTARKRESAQVREGPVVSQVSSSEAIQAAWFREKISTKGRDFYVDRESLQSIGPIAPLLHFAPTTATKRQERKNPGNLLKWWSSSKAQPGEGGTGASKPLAKTKASDVYFSVRTTLSNHRKRLPLMLDTWISLVPRQVRIITDSADDKLDVELQQRFSKQRPQLIPTDCPIASHSKWSLLCKIYMEYQQYMSTEPKESWFCHFDDDTYVNIKNLLTLLDHFDPKEAVYLGKAPSRDRATKTIVYNTQKRRSQTEDNEDFVDEAKLVSFHFALGGAGLCLSKRLAENMLPYFTGSSLVQTAASISLPDDCVLGFVITHKMNVSLVNVDQMHSHIENMSVFEFDSLADEVTFSYKRGNVSSTSADPQRLAEQSRINVEDASTIRRLHKLLFDTKR